MEIVWKVSAGCVLIGILWLIYWINKDFGIDDQVMDGDEDGPCPICNGLEPNKSQCENCDGKGYLL